MAKNKDNVKQNILVTGANGFIGSQIIQQLRDSSLFSVSGTLRLISTDTPFPINLFQVGNINAHTEWREALKGIEVVIHTAAHIPIHSDATSSSLDSFRRVNVDGTVALAKQAVSMGVRRLIFVSTIKVNGEWTTTEQPFTCDDDANPQDPYGITKWEAEQELQEIASYTDLDVVIIRPPLVYGPGVKGNFLTMLRWLERGAPLPLGSIHNKRSIVSIDNLANLVITCIDHPAAANQTFFVSDGEDISTTELLQRISIALGKHAWLIPVPETLLWLSARLLGKKEIAQRLLGNLQVDISKTNEQLGWTPLINIDEGLNKTAEWYLNQ